MFPVRYSSHNNDLFVTTSFLKADQKAPLLNCNPVFRPKRSTKFYENFVRMSVGYVYIPKISLYNFDHLKPHFYIVKLGFTGIYIIFLISAQNIDCGYLLEPPR